MAVDKIVVGNVYEITSGQCGSFNLHPAARYVKFISENTYDILDEDLVRLDGCSYCLKPKDLTEKIGVYQQGAILVDKDGDERKILGVCGEVYFVSYANKLNSVLLMGTKADLDLRDFKLKTTQEVKEMTVADVEKLAGCKVKIIKE